MPRPGPSVAQLLKYAPHHAHAVNISLPSSFADTAHVPALAFATALSSTSQRAFAPSVLRLPVTLRPLGGPTCS